MFLHYLIIFSINFIGITYGVMTTDELARCISAGSPYANDVELVAQGFTCQQDPDHPYNGRVRKSVTDLAQYILNGKISDPTQGANRWFTPRFMPKESENATCRPPIGNGNLDCDGGLEVSCGITQRYRPSWADPDKKLNIYRVRDCEAKFFKI